MYMKVSEILINAPGGTLQGTLSVPDHSGKLVIFSHGSGSSRFSPRNRFVSKVLNDAGIATLLVDLLTVGEDSIYEKRFDISLLTERLETVTDYCADQKDYVFKYMGYFGASTGAASALNAAAARGSKIVAIVSRGGRPDLAYDNLDKVHCPVLLIVGSLDDQVLFLNRRAYDKLDCEKQLEVVNGATHLFDEPGTLEKAAQLACDWFIKHFN